MTKTNYRQIVNPDYMGSYSLDNGNNGYITIDATLLRTDSKEVIDPAGKKKMCIIGHTNLPKPFIINSKAQKVLQAITKSRYVEDWKDVPITFWVETGFKAFGDLIDVLRIKHRNVKSEVDYTEQHLSLKSCTTLDQLQKVYTAFSADQKTATVNTKDECKLKLSNPELV